MPKDSMKYLFIIFMWVLLYGFLGLTSFILNQSHGREVLPIIGVLFGLVSGSVFTYLLHFSGGLTNLGKQPKTVILSLLACSFSIVIVAALASIQVYASIGIALLTGVSSGFFIPYAYHKVIK